MHRLTATLTSVAERVDCVVQQHRARPSIPSRDVTLAALALAPRTRIEFTDEEARAVEAALVAPQLAAR
jgi:hypothetical protein